MSLNQKSPCENGPDLYEILNFHSVVRNFPPRHGMLNHPHSFYSYAFYVCGPHACINKSGEKV